MEHKPPGQEPNTSETRTAADIYMDMLGDARPQVLRLPKEYEEQRKIASDKSLPLIDRMEAFEDVMESEVGDTNLTRSRNLEREFNLRQLFLKFEGGNPTGTQKDRITFAHVQDALRRGYETITVATCGNYGVALSLAAFVAGLRCVIFIPETYHTKRIKEMVDYGAEIRRVPGDYEASVAASQLYAAEHEIYDANPGGVNTDLQIRAYGQIAYEIYDELRDAPATVSVPVSNGTTFAGIYRGFLSLFRRGKTSRMPTMICGSSHKKNPIIRAYRNNSASCLDLQPRNIRETAVNEPLINWHAADGDQALDAIRATGGWAADATDKGMTHLSKLLREREGLSVIPASTAGLAALLSRHTKDPVNQDRHVTILTGRR